MPLATCSRFLRPWFGRITPSLGFSRLSRCRLFHSLDKRPHFAANRLQTVRQVSGTGKNSDALSDNALLVVGLGFLGGSLAYVSMLWTLFCIEFAESSSVPQIQLYLCSFSNHVWWRKPSVQFSRGLQSLFISPIQIYNVFFMKHTGKDTLKQTIWISSRCNILISSIMPWRCSSKRTTHRLNFYLVNVKIYTYVLYMKAQS